MGDHSPIKSKPYRVPFSQRPIIEEQIKTMLEKNIIRPSTSPWSSNVVLVAKKDGSRRFCIDFRKLNKITNKETYPLPRIDETLDAFGKAQYFSALDLAAGYWQIGMAPEDIEETAFTTVSGHFEFMRMLFGLCNAAPRCQQFMDFLLAGLQWEFVSAILMTSSFIHVHLLSICLIYVLYLSGCVQPVLKFALQNAHFVARKYHIWVILFRRMASKLTPRKLQLYETTQFLPQ